ncbi:MAG TPA: threonine--tRNA ligase [Candidatus Saccharimonadales bacterium]|nr:threonine--tRNA ligase [Candidatus Saccharimonadales bacterium]
MGKAAPKQTDDLEAMRHSLAHIMASAVQKLWPEAKFGVGPAIEDGFYYDIDLADKTISEDDFAKIEAEMIRIIKEDQKFEHSNQPIDAAIAWAKSSKQPYKEELLNDLKREGTTLASELNSSMMGLPAGISGVTPAKAEVGEVSFYKNGDFIDLCRGPHVASTGKAGAFKLTKVAGAYWRGNEKNRQMQRVYGVAFPSQKELDKYLEQLEEAKKRDHRKLGRELDLFVTSPLVGAGLPLFTPRGTVLRDELNKYSQELREQIGYQKIWTPHIAKQELYEVSGHWDKFGDEWLKVQSQESHDNLVMKPMNCPHHQQIYASRPRSYRDLPLKYMETTTDYRDEKAGELLGLSRVRAITQDDSHTFCTPEQIEEVLKALVIVVKDFYKVLGLPLKVRLSFRDESDSYLGDKKLWDKAQGIIQKVVEDSELEYYEGIGEAAFYGPKIDFMAQDALGRELQVATPQLDFIQPERFGLKYADKDGSEKTPVMVHFALLGSIERFLSVYIEHTAGRFPVWLAPEQIRIITVNQEDKTTKFAESILEKAKELSIRAFLDNDNESVGKKIRQAETMKVPYTIVIGEKEIESGEVIPRVRSDMEVQREHVSHKIEDFLGTVRNEVRSRVTKTSL